MLLNACEQAVRLQVESEVPTALIETLPLRVGVYYAPALGNHSYEENSPERQNWSISSGNAQLAMFDRVLGATFDTIVLLTEIPADIDGRDLDLVIAPTIREMQFAIPSETFFDFYEAWIAYDIEMYSRLRGDGEKWQLTAYGKAPKKRFGGRTEGLRSAMNFALRDIGAKLSTGLTGHPVVTELRQLPR